MRGARFHIVLFFIFTATFVFCFGGSDAQAATLDLHGWAWSSNIGWVGFNCADVSACATTNYKVTFNDVSGNISGYAWSSNIGWVQFDPASTGCPRGACPPKVNLSGGADKQVTGWVRACTVFVAGCSGSLKSNAARGGWDGWIELSGTNHISPATCPTPTTCIGGVTYRSGLSKFVGFAWGGDVIGWLNFDQVTIPTFILTVNSAGATAVPITGVPAFYGGITDYTKTVASGSSFTLTAPATKSSDTFSSWTGCNSVSGPGNRDCNVTMTAPRTVTVNYTASSIPVTSDVSVVLPDYCKVGPSATIGWNYSDLSGSPQSAYQVQIDNNGSFSSPEVDSGKIICQNCRSYFSGTGILQFNTTYNARVRTWNGNDIPSLWQEATSCNGDGCIGGGSGDWKTPRHAYPNVNPPYDFTYSPSNPSANSPVQFTDNTLFDPISITRAWSWLFVPAGGGSGSSSSQNPIYTFNRDGIYTVTERVRDDAVPAGKYCIGPDKIVNVKKPIPIWKEIAPR